MQDFTRLRVWQRAQDITVDIYVETEHLDHRRFPGLRSQLRRAASSIAANIAEGASHGSAAQHARYLGMAIGSASEVQNHLALARRLGALSAAVHARLDREIQLIRQMLIVLQRRVIG